MTLISLAVERSVPRSTREDRRVAPRRTPGRLLPHRLGPYELFDHVGKGGMADIYRARVAAESGALRQVVIKEVLPELLVHERFAELLIAEAKLASRLAHTNIVRVEHLGRDEGSLYIAMEFVEGLDLRELLRRCARQKVGLPIELSLRIVMEVLRGLDFAHRFRWEDAPHPSLERRIGIVHRDVSPSNVLLSFDGEVKICDFGIARAHDEPNEEGQPLSKDMVEGKAGYMSPEQARGESLDGRADVFALGIILFELMSGRKLYKAGPDETLLDVAKRAEIPEPPKRGLPHEEELHVIMKRALEPSPDDRYPSAAAMLRDLEGYSARTGLVGSTIKLGTWLAENFEDEIIAAQSKREKAVKALARGPVAVLTVVEAPSESEPPSEVSPTSEVRSVEDVDESPQTPEPGANRLVRPKKKRRKMVEEGRARPKMEDPPKSLEGTASDVPPMLRPEAKRSPYLILLALLAAVGVVVTLYVLGTR